MRIEIYETHAGAVHAHGLAVVVDVFLASTTACCAVAAGAQAVIVATNLEQAETLQAANSERVLLGGVDCAATAWRANSPCMVDKYDISGREVILVSPTTSRGLDLALSEAQEVVLGAFVNAAAVVKYVQSSAWEDVMLLALGTEGKVRSQEDTMCAMYVKNELEGYPNSFAALKGFLGTIESALPFFDPDREDALERDFDMCMNLDCYDFLLRAEQLPDGTVRLVRTGC